MIFRIKVTFKWRTRDNIYFFLSNSILLVEFISIEYEGYPVISIDSGLSISSVQSLSRVQLFVTPWIVAHQASLSITNSRSPPKLVSIESVMPSSHLILCRPLLPPQTLPASGSFPMSQLFASASVHPMNTQDWSPLGWTVGSPCSPRDSQESSMLQFKSINSSALSFLHSPTLTSIHGH